MRGKTAGGGDRFQLVSDFYGNLSSRKGPRMVLSSRLKKPCVHPEALGGARYARSKNQEVLVVSDGLAETLSAQVVCL